MWLILLPLALIDVISWIRWLKENESGFWNLTPTYSAPWLETRLYISSHGQEFETQEAKGWSEAAMGRASPATQTPYWDSLFFQSGWKQPIFLCNSKGEST